MSLHGHSLSYILFVSEGSRGSVCDGIELNCAAGSMCDAQSPRPLVFARSHVNLLAHLHKQFTHRSLTPDKGFW